MYKLILFAILMFCQVLCSFALSLLQPFFPPYAIDKGISEFQIGLIFSANPFGAISAALLIGKVLTPVFNFVIQKNRYVFICTGLFMQAVGLFLFAATKYEDKYAIIATGIVARLINGFGTSAYITPVYAYISILFPDTIEKKLSIAEGSLAIGFMVGPVLGSALYSLGGYNLPFISFGIIALIFVPILWFSLHFVQRRIDKVSPIKEKESDEVKAEHKEVEPDHFTQLIQESQYRHSLKSGQSPSIVNPPIKANALSQLSIHYSMVHAHDGSQQRRNSMDDPDNQPLEYSKVMSSYSITMTAISGFCVTFMFNFLSPINANYLHDEYDIEVGRVGYYLVIMPLGYICSSTMISYVKNRKVLVIVFIYLKYILIGGLLLGLSSLVAGPDTQIVHLPQKIYVTMIGLTMMGASASLMIIFNIPVINNILLNDYPNRPNPCANMSSALFTSGTFLGELIGPISAGLLTTAYGYPRAVTIMGLTILFFSLLYIPVTIRHIKDEEKAAKRLQGLETHS